MTSTSYKYNSYLFAGRHHSWHLLLAMLFSQQYQQLPTVEKGTCERASFRQDTRKRRVGICLRTIIIIAIMWSSFTATTRTISRIKGFWAACQGPQRNSSTLAQLPSHYTLPSGDKIPSVALGMSLLNYCAISLSLIIQVYGRLAGVKLETP
jgi:hypothetical protein